MDKDLSIFGDILKVFEDREHARNAAGPLMMMFGLILLLLTRTSSGPLQNAILVFAGVLIVGGMIVTYVAVVRRSTVSIARLPSAADDLGLAVEQLSRNYEWIRSQTMYTFYLSTIFMALGILVILFGSVRVILGLAESTDALTIVAGVISEFISGSALLLYRSGSQRLDEISQKLHQTWRILVAYRLAKELPEPDQKDAILPLIIALAGTLVETPSLEPATSKEYGSLLEKIEFDYQDPPTKHSWRIVDCPDKTRVSLRFFDDGFVGRALEIEATVRYAMDCTVSPSVELGSVVEFVTKLETGGSVVYARLSVQSSDSSRSKAVWFNFPVGKGQPWPHGDGSSEWSFPVTPTHLGGNWLQFRVDLNEAVRQTYGKDGWRFEKLRGFRLRGNLSLAYISVFEAGQ